MMIEFFGTRPTGSLDSRTEMWLAEADEFGMVFVTTSKPLKPTHRKLRKLALTVPVLARATVNPSITD